MQLDITGDMTDLEAGRLSKQVAALDRALQNKLVEYNNLSRKDVTLYDSFSTCAFKSVGDLNKEKYNDLFDKTNEKKNRYAGIGRQVPLRTEWFYNCASSNLVTYTWKG